MNKNMALTVVGVILLGMALVAYNEYSTEPKAPNANTQATADITKPSPVDEQKNPQDEAKTKPEQSTAALTPPTAPAKAEDWAKNAPLAPSTPSPIAPSAPLSEPIPAAPTQAPAAASTEDKTATPEVAKAEQPKPKEVAKVEEQKPTPEKAEAKPAAPAKEEKKPAPAKAEVAKAIKKISILTIGDGVTVRIDSTQVPPYKSMQLKNPPRLVLDLTGDWKVKAPGVPKNDFVSNVRIGQQKDGTRIVVDLKKTPASVRYLKYGDNGLDVRIR